jgi:hypothetical protein
MVSKNVRGHRLGQKIPAWLAGSGANLIPDGRSTDLDVEIGEEVEGCGPSCSVAD